MRYVWLSLSPLYRWRNWGRRLKQKAQRNTPRKWQSQNSNQEVGSSCTSSPPRNTLRILHLSWLRVLGKQNLNPKFNLLTPYSGSNLRKGRTRTNMKLDREGGKQMQGVVLLEQAAASQYCTWWPGLWDDSIGPHKRTAPGQGFINWLLPIFRLHWLTPTPRGVNFLHLQPSPSPPRDSLGPWGPSAGMVIIPPVVHVVCTLVGLR